MTLTGGRSKFSPNLSAMGYNWAMMASTDGLLLGSTTRQAPEINNNNNNNNNNNEVLH